uniref:EGF-like domain-containing protein n=1 Tax=Ascaris lumbricoides TaxID=6252 RepID=A0A0M3ID48_ASCLU
MKLHGYHHIRVLHRTDEVYRFKSTKQMCFRPTGVLYFRSTMSEYCLSFYCGGIRWSQSCNCVNISRGGAVCHSIASRNFFMSSDRCAMINAPQHYCKNSASSAERHCFDNEALTT